MTPYVDLDAEIESVERILMMCREGVFTGLTAAIEREIAENMLPGIAALAEDEERAALAARYRRLDAALRADLTQRKAPTKRRPIGYNLTLGTRVEGSHRGG
jgi:hypothetical protein